MVIGYDCGHTLSGAGTGAIGCGKKEQDLTRLVGKELDRLLKLKGHKTVNCTVDKSNNQLADRVRKANAQHLDYFVSIHFNAFNGSAKGTESYVYPNTPQANVVADRICNNISKLGYVNRGRKVTKDLYVVTYTNAPAILVECCFIDNTSDMQKLNIDAMAKAIAEGILGESIVEPSQPTGLWAVCVGAYQYNTAKAKVEELKAKGYKDTYLIPR